MAMGSLLVAAINSADPSGVNGAKRERTKGCRLSSLSRRERDGSRGRGWGGMLFSRIGAHGISEGAEAMVKLAAGMGRLGTESAFEVLARAKALEAQGRSIINLGIGQPDFRTPEHIVEAAAKALRDGHHGYTPANGIPQLREAVAADLQ